MKKWIYRFLLLCICLSLTIWSMTGCAAQGTNNTGTTTQNSQSEGSSATSFTTAASDDNAAENIVNTAATTAAAVVQAADVDDEDTQSEWDETTATKVELNGSSITVDGEGASAQDNILTITKAGTYVVSGTLDDGQILVAAGESDTVRLILNGAQITNTTGAPIYASSADKLIVTLAEGTENTLTDGGQSFQYAIAADEEPNAALFAKCDLSINGAGSLTVNASFNNGIGTKDDLIIASGNFTITATNDGLRGRDSVTVLSGSLDITAGGDGIQSNNADDTDKGWIYIESGAIKITSANDGIQAETSLTITGGEFNISTGGGAQKAETVASSDTTSDSFKGLKSASDMTVSGGSFTIDSADDSVHANGNITLSGGTFSLSSGDDGVHADGDLSVNTDIQVTTSYEGLEAANLIITGGNIDLTSSDDGLNAAGGSDQDMGGGRFGQDQFAASGNYSVQISGGTVKLKAGGDGIDSNGSITISGGTVISLINSSADNGAMDCTGSIAFTGGTIIYGGSGTGNNPTDGSTQSYVYISSAISAGTEVTVQKDGQTLISFTPDMNCSTLALSSPDIVSGESYDIYSGSTLLQTVTAGSGGGGMMGGPGGGGGKGSGRGMRGM